ARLRQLLLQALVESPPIPKTGERTEVGQAFQLALALLLRRHVLHRQGCPELALHLAPVAIDLDHVRFAAAVADACLDRCALLACEGFVQNPALAFMLEREIAHEWRI